jgi:hypothetical protein
MSEKERKNALRDRIANNQRTKGGERGSTILDLSKAEDVQFYKVKPGKNKIDILPYTVATNHHPQGIKKGEPDYILDIYTHKRIGLGKKNILCLNKTFNKSCPICEERDRLIEEGNDALAENIKATRRAIYNIIDCTDEEKGVQLLDMTHFFFEKELLEKLKIVEDEEGNGAIIFADLEEGRSISFRASEETYNKNKFFKFKDFTFDKRETAYDEDAINTTFPLDDLLIVPAYDEVKALLFGSEDEEETTNAPDEKEEEEKTPVRKVLKKKTEELVHGTERKPSPVKEKMVTKDCPFKHVFGKDCDQTDECKACDMWNDCVDEFEAKYKDKK